MHSHRPGAAQRGFTLIEVMIAVVIVAILATVAVPSYRSFIERSHRAVAKTALADVVSRQESYRLDHKRYATALGKLGWGADTLYLGRDGALRGAQASDDIYAITLQGGAHQNSCTPGGAPSATGFTAVATPIGAQAGDTRCAALCLSSAGLKGASGSAPGDCWKR